MKTIPVVFLFVLLCILSTFSACTKHQDEFLEVKLSDHLDHPETFPNVVNIDSILQLEFSAPIPFPETGRYNCNVQKLYKDTLLYNESNGKEDFIVKVSSKPGNGKFYAWPIGLVIDSITGSINVSASQGGYKYTVGFVKEGTKDTCLQNIILSGASYKDKIYVLSENDTLAYPYFNGNPNSAAICDDSGDDDYQDGDDVDDANEGNAKCEFDGADNKGRKGRANRKHVKVRTISGAINLKKTVDEGAFGSAEPGNGHGLNVPVYYKLNDKGAKALQKVDVQLIFYKTRSEIPLRLLDYINRRSTLIETGSLISANGSTRPPLIVIVRS